MPIESFHDYSPQEIEAAIEMLPMAPTYQELVDAGYDDLPINEEDWQRLENFFKAQVGYYRQLAQEARDKNNVDSEEDAKYFEMCADRIPELYQLIKDNFRIITQEDYMQCVAWLKEELAPEMDGDYIVIMHGKDLDEAKKHSTYMVANDMELDPQNFISSAELSSPEIVARINQGAKIFIVDDGAYSSSNISDHIRDLKDSGAKITQGQVRISVVGATGYAIKKFYDMDIKPEVSVAYRIPQFSEIPGVDQYDCRIMRFMQRVDHENNNIQLLSQFSEVLTMFWQKVPDNMLSQLRKQKNHWWDGKNHNYFDGWLVNDMPDGIYPDYRAGTRFMYS